MTAGLFYTLYFILAFAQAILTARYVLDIVEEGGPVFWVVLMTIFAPLVTIGLLIYGFRTAVTWLVTYRTPKQEETETK